MLTLPCGKTMGISPGHDLHVNPIHIRSVTLHGNPVDRRWKRSF